MSLILSLVLTIAFIVIYILLVEIFTVLFRLTGLTKEKAHFQVISLLTNSGFSTNESEIILNNQSRRRLAKVTMITGSIFNVIIVSLIINSLLNIDLETEIESLKVIGIAIGIFVFLMIVIRLPIVKRGFEKLIEKIANAISKRKHSDNLITELDVYGRDSIVEVYVSKLPEELNHVSIAQSPLKSTYNTIVLLIQRNGKFINVKNDTMIQKDDRLVMFGKTAMIKELFDVDEKEKEINETPLNIISLIDNYGSNAVAEIEINRIPLILKDKTLKESIIKDDYDINVLMIKHNGKEVLVNEKTIIQQGDKVLLIGPYHHIENIFLNENQLEKIEINN